jgi:hypothetical protein
MTGVDEVDEAGTDEFEAEADEDEAEDEGATDDADEEATERLELVWTEAAS